MLKATTRLLASKQVLDQRFQAGVLIVRLAPDAPASEIIGQIHGLITFVRDDRRCPPRITHTGTPNATEPAFKYELSDSFRGGSIAGVHGREDHLQVALHDGKIPTLEGKAGRRSNISQGFLREYRICPVGLVSLIQSPMCQDSLLLIEGDAHFRSFAPRNAV